LVPNITDGSGQNPLGAPPQAGKHIAGGVSKSSAYIRSPLGVELTELALEIGPRKRVALDEREPYIFQVLPNLPPVDRIALAFKKARG
jgi:hypothetical protein